MPPTIKFFLKCILKYCLKGKRYPSIKINLWILKNKILKNKEFLQNNIHIN